MLGIQLELRNNNSQREWKTYTKYVLASEQSNKKKEQKQLQFIGYTQFNKLCLIGTQKTVCKKFISWHP